ncbi:MAG: hypothetical protein ACI9R3_005598, partial [Verrucomicrobiales bacterium]
VTVNQASLTITAEDKQRGTGLPNPPLTVSYSGFVNGDTAVDGAPTLSTTAVLSSAPGTYSITVSGGVDANYSITRVAGTLTVSDKELPELAWSAPSPIVYGTVLGSEQLNATANVAGSFSYSPSAGTVLSAGTSTLTVTFTPADSFRYATVTDTVSLMVNQATSTITWGAPTAIVYGTALSGAQLNATISDDAQGSFSYAPAVGTVLHAGVNQLSVRFTPSTGNIESVTEEVSITVNKASLTITAEDKQRGTGLPNPPLTASYSGFVNGDTAVDGAPTLSTTAVLNSAAGTYPITVSGGADSDYSITRVAGTLTVSDKELPELVWAAPSPIVYGTVLGSEQLNATANVAGSFSYSPSAGTVLSAGTSTLTLTFTPADPFLYATVTDTVSLTVNQATATITWAAPTAIVYGTTLSAAQLNASTSTPGTLSYTPELGAVPHAGDGQTLSVSLAASANYESATATVSIDVRPASLTITADDKQRGTGLPNPRLTANYSGFVSGDDADSLDVAATVSTIATEQSLVGTYPIVVDGAADSNYTISFVLGTLTVIASEPSGYEEWAAENIGGAGSLNFDADADGDSFFNGAEYYWSGNPLKSDSPEPLPRLVESAVTWAIPDNTPDDVIMTLLQSSDLIHWERIFDTIGGALVREVSQVNTADGGYDLMQRSNEEASYYRFELKLHQMNYQEWAARFIGDVGNKDFNADADGDGVFNGAEYFWNGNPLQTDNSEPSLEVVDGFVSWSFKDSSPSDVIMTWSQSTDLIRWEPIYNSVSGALIPEVTQVVLSDGAVDIAHRAINRLTYYRFAIRFR